MLPDTGHAAITLNNVRACAAKARNVATRLFLHVAIRLALIGNGGPTDVHILAPT